MCDTPEIQDQWKPKVGDKCCATERDHNNDVDEVCIVQEVSTTQGIISLSLLGLNNKEGAAWFYPKMNIWLPRQEDIQEMRFESEKHMSATYAYQFFAAMCGWVKPRNMNDTNVHADCLTLEYYMADIHKKTWTEEGWR